MAKLPWRLVEIPKSVTCLVVYCVVVFRFCFVFLALFLCVLRFFFLWYPSACLVSSLTSTRTRIQQCTVLVRPRLHVLLSRALTYCTFVRCLLLVYRFTYIHLQRGRERTYFEAFNQRVSIFVSLEKMRRERACIEAFIGVSILDSLEKLFVAVFFFCHTRSVLKLLFVNFQIDGYRLNNNTVGATPVSVDRVRG